MITGPSFSQTFFYYLDLAQRKNAIQPLRLGGSAGGGGGIGGPPGGFSGSLPQTRVCYDTTEAEDWVVPSGSSLLTNLNRIRYRILQLETNKTTVQQGGITIATQVDVIDFYSGALVTIIPSGVRVVVSGGAGGASDHATLSHLAYADAGHTGFEPTVTKGNLYANSNRIVVISGIGVVIGSGTSVDVDETKLNIANMTGTLEIGHGGTGQITAPLAINALLPSQGGNAGKILTTDATNPSWSINNNILNGGRLTLTTGVPVTISDVTTATVVYYTPYTSGLISLYNGSSKWDIVSFSEISIKLTDAQTGNTHNGTKIINGLTDTSQLIIGMEVTGTHVGASAKIVSVDSTTQVTVDVNSTGNATETITFKVPTTRILDIFVFNNSGTAKLEMVLWTSDSARATALTTQDGIYVKSGTTTRKFLGSIRTSAAGTTRDRAYSRMLSNYYNRVEKSLTTAAAVVHTYTTAVWRAMNSDTTVGSMRTEFLACLADYFMYEMSSCSCLIAVNSGCAPGSCLNSTTLVDTYTNPSSSNASTAFWWDAPSQLIAEAVTLGYNYVNCVEYGAATSGTYEAARSSCIVKV